MSDDALATYIHDHLAGAAGALDVLEDLRDDHAGEPLGDFAAELLSEIEQDRDVLQRLADNLGGGYSKPKEAVAWVGAKLARVKLGRTLAGELGVFLALETLALGIVGKLSLWRALATVSDADLRLRGIDFERLSARAEQQHARVEERRLAAARSALQPSPQ